MGKELSDAARELELYMNNDGTLYRQNIEPIHKNLEKKIAKGTFSLPLSVKLWSYAVEAAAKKYVKEFGGTWNKIFPKADRDIVAHREAIHFALNHDIYVSEHDQKAVFLYD